MENRWVFDPESIIKAPEHRPILGNTDVTITVSGVAENTGRVEIKGWQRVGEGEALESPAGMPYSGDYITVDEAASILRLSVRTIYNLLRGGKLEGKKYGRQWRIRRASLGGTV